VRESPGAGRTADRATSNGATEGRGDELLVSEINARRFHPMFVDGKEYTECQRAAEPIGRFRDYVLVAQTNTGPCGRDAGQWE